MKYSDCSEGVDQIIELQDDANYIRLQLDGDCPDEWEITELIASQVCIMII